MGGGGRIDTAHHESKAMKALDETAELAKAVETAVRMVDLEETLVVVTSDHSHTMTYNGYSRRGSNVLGLANKMNSSSGLPYSILSYATGPGHRSDSNHDFRLDDMDSLNYTYPSLFPMVRETHGGEDVAVFAAGPWAHLFTGNYEQNFIPHAIAYAACIGTGLQASFNSAASSPEKAQRSLPQYVFGRRGGKTPPAPANASRACSYAVL
ncbi:hypothetical protein EVAR_76767_1 [Eumeta japonica]|uniref:alkaline phosphatase n=1 Tax=Eumeta variegata TaxID=151549 RepID=A0A4C1STR9_EUMVA|nr:hypothetical protein EVAR_76767_1 [Eumeta japonica]